MFLSLTKSVTAAVDSVPDFYSDTFGCVILSLT